MSKQRHDVGYWKSPPGARIDQRGKRARPAPSARLAEDWALCPVLQNRSEALGVRCVEPPCRVSRYWGSPEDATTDMSCWRTGPPQLRSEQAYTVVEHQKLLGATRP